MVRFLFNLATLISLLLAVIVCVLWGRSRSFDESYSFLNHRFTARSTWHGLGLNDNPQNAGLTFDPNDSNYVTSVPTEDHRVAWPMIQAFYVETSDFSVPFLGFRFWYVTEDKTAPNGLPVQAGGQLNVPHWMAMLASLVLPMWWLLLRVLRRVRPGCCRKCGYDLRGNVGACPECGAAR